VRELGDDLLVVRHWERLFTLALPFAWCGAYFAFAAIGWWPAAVVALVALSFVTYGSTSHDLVHRSLGLSMRTNDIFLSVIELLAFRSGHAYQAVHLHHHATFPDENDIEAAAARGSFVAALLHGVVFQFRICKWATRHAARKRKWIVAEGIACVVLAALVIASISITPIFVVYMSLMILGSWIIPLMTSYIPHRATGVGPLDQTKAFRGVIASLITIGHLYHLEHHLYPKVPHRRWSRLAKRLDPYLSNAGVRPIRLWF
jgi:beta-carotene hydroxylase